ncbi:Protein of unknown function, partial [Gryllus bimaculatus]
RGGRV